MPESDQAFHDSQKPSWGPDSTLIYAMASKGGLVRRSKSARMSSTVLEQKGLLVSEGKDLCFAKYAVTPDVGCPPVGNTVELSLLTISSSSRQKPLRSKERGRQLLPPMEYHTPKCRPPISISSPS